MTTSLLDCEQERGRGGAGEVELRTLPLWAENLLQGMTRVQRTPYITDRERAVDQQVLTVASLLQIESLLNRLPKQLSGGQKQRVALGRCDRT